MTQKLHALAAYLEDPVWFVTTHMAALHHLPLYFQGNLMTFAGLYDFWAYRECSYSYRYKNIKIVCLKSEIEYLCPRECLWKHMKKFLGPHFYDVRNQHKEIWPVSKSGRETSTEIPDNFCYESISLESQYEIPSVSRQGFSGERLNYD